MKLYALVEFDFNKNGIKKLDKSPQNLENIREALQDETVKVKSGEFENYLVGTIVASWNYSRN